MTPDPHRDDADERRWFTDGADARKYLGEVGRLWGLWIVGLAALAVSGGPVAVIFGLGLLVALYVQMGPLQRRAKARFAEETAATGKDRGLTRADRALRELMYGTKPYAEALETAGVWSGLRVVPFIAWVATVIAGIAVVVAWIKG